jgi:hypothetical protein
MWLHTKEKDGLMQASAKAAPADVKVTPLAALVAQLAPRLAAVIDAALQQLIHQLEVQCL